MGEGAGYRWAMKATIIALLVLAVIAIPVSAMTKGAPGALAASIGVGVAALVGLVTQASMARAYRLNPTTMAGVMAFSWLGKMVILVVVLALLRQVDDFERIPFGLTAVAGVIASVVIDVIAMRNARVPNVDPGSGSAPQ